METDHLRPKPVALALRNTFGKCLAVILYKQNKKRRVMLLARRWADEGYFLEGAMVSLVKAFAGLILTTVFAGS